MKVISVPISDATFLRGSQMAAALKLEFSALCGGVLGDYFNQDSGKTSPEIDSLPPDELDAAGFDVGTNFRGFPLQSIRFAERFLTEVLRVDPTVKISKHGDSTIDIRDNFVRIEAVLRRKKGIRVSFYGEPTAFKNPPEILVRGMGSYSRAVVESEKDLETILPFIEAARTLKRKK